MISRSEEGHVNIVVNILDQFSHDSYTLQTENYETDNLPK